MLKNIISITQIAVYYLFESLLIGIVLYLAWRNIMPKFNVNIQLSYIDCTTIIWFYKLMKFNVFTFISNSDQYINEEECENNEQE
jgi:hypothetical protein